MITIKKLTREEPPPNKSVETENPMFGEVELYLSSFPASSLVLGQIESSGRAFADLSLLAAVAGRQFPPPLPPPSS
jgi:hypothetical protein